MDCKYERSCEASLRESLYTQKKRLSFDNRFSCHTLTDYRTIVDDFYKVVEFVEWLKEYYPDKASYHTSKM